MKKIYLFLVFSLPLMGNSQEKIPYIDGQQTIELASQAGQEGNYEKSLEILSRISPNDSSYIHSLISKSYYLLNSNRFGEAVKVANSGLALDCGSSCLSLFINKGVAYLTTNQWKKALSNFEEGLKRYPRNPELWYNKGLALENMERVQEAIAAYQHAVLLSPLYAQPHLRLGNISYQQQLTAQAMMSFNMYLMLNPDGGNSFNVLKHLDDLVQTKNSFSPKPGVEIYDASLEQLNLLLDNRLALNDQYQVETQINVPLTKQNHLLLSQLASHEGGEGFWGEVYLPLYQWIWENGHFEEFTNLVAFSTQNKALQKIIRKDVEGLKSFMSSFLDQWGDILHLPTFRVLPQDEGLQFNYYNLKLNGVGKAEAGTEHGSWKFYDTEGALAGEGSYNLQGERIGFWKWYYPEGGVRETAHYEKGFLEGENKGFFSNGKMEYVAHYKKDQLEGEHLRFNVNGALLEKKYFSNGALEGKYRSNFPVGEVLKEFEVFYRNGQVEDKAFEYFANGQVFAEMSFREDQKHGPEKRYNREGGLYSEMEYAESIPIGSYLSYHLNGNIQERGGYIKGKLEGRYEVFYEDGVLESIGQLKEGLYQGVFQHFDRDGTLHYEFDYKNGEIVAYRYFSKTGEILASGKRKGGKFRYRSYTPYGQLTSEGLYDISGGKKGLWKYYSENGVITGQGEYQEDKAVGLHKEYYETGGTLSESTYENDTLNGYYRTFFPDGQMESQGWYQDGLEHGEWRSYYPDGALQARNFFHKGEFHGIQEYNGVEGNLKSDHLYEFGEAVWERFYDLKGNLFEEIERGKGGEYVQKTHHFNSTVSQQISYVNGIKHGLYIRLDHQGKKIEEGPYLNGFRNGSWVSYFPNGKKKGEMQFSRGELHGEVITYLEDGSVENRENYRFGVQNGKSEFFHPNGQASVLTTYSSGKVNGRKEFYDPSGRLELVRFYDHGRLMGYSYLNGNSEELPMIPLKNETGTLKAYFDNGQVSREVAYLHGNMDGTYRSYYYTGEIKYQAEYHLGNYHGTVKNFYQDGKTRSEKSYSYGKLHGPSREYFENGQLKEEVEYVHDLKHGNSTTYNEQGVLVRKEQYSNDSIYETEKI